MPQPSRLFPAHRVAQHKALARSYIRRRRKHTPVTEEIERRFTQHLSQLIAELEPGSTLAGFLPLATEPPITGALREAVEQGHTVLAPVVLPHHHLGWVRWHPQEPTQVNSLGILEPTGERLDSGAFVEADLRLVPALAVDRQGRRLGQGGGYYDRLFEMLGEKALSPSTAGVVFDRELLDGLPAEPWDAQLSTVVTEEGVRRITPSSTPPAR
ncbi:5-formyltetrahydrofolate cyclo-ligase [Rothia nasimurium]|uniref:5-formyltetrahydrofolate cyclo-ligase n=1 Tax=Rothia nasimurium TaxID=85336 RepID=A0A1Y1RS38_9MICC|nr:5-formyltetrahydrofolate cyclo-ligase [Rothia nasimurium]ORC24493.1 5-formyltetrahydrofolate cyclo-ligase [Rothia nasimurium]